MKKFMLGLPIMAVLIFACTPAPAQPATLTVMTHDSFDISSEVIQIFEIENDVKVLFLKSGDAGAALNKAILSKDVPLADVFFGVDNTFLSRALEADIFESYAAPNLETVSAEFQYDSQNRVTPIDYGDVCINFDRAYFADKNLTVPASLQDLTKPEYKGLLVVENPATSSPGLAFLITSIAEFGDPGYLDFWAALRANDVQVVDGWETAYYTNFSASAGKGLQPMVVSYASSPAAEVYFAETPPAQAPTASIVADGTCFRQVEFAGILKGTTQPELAQKFINFMLSIPFQEDLPLRMFVYPVNQNASLPQVFIDHAQTAQNPASLPAETIAANREKWIEAWAKAVIR